jgi:hypothetical protein
LRWNYNLKTKLRYNFAEDSKRTWNKIKMTASLSSEIKPEQFANHYGENWSNFPRKMNIEEYNEYTKHNKREKLNLSRFEADILNEETIKRCITSKGNLSAPDLDRLTYPIFKYCPDKAAKLFRYILKMMLKTNKCPQCWKDGKTMMPPKSVANEEEKKRPENWGPITLMGAMHRITFGIIANYL